MAWFALARLLFVGAVSYMAYQLHLLAGDLSNLLLGFVLGGVFVALEIRLKEISVTRLIGALLGGALGFIAARTVGAALAVPAMAPAAAEGDRRPRPHVPPSAAAGT